MDRAHRLGQTKEVTVYRLVCRNTVEEKILRRAAQKNTVQQLVMTGQQQGDVFSADEVSDFRNKLAVGGHIAATQHLSLLSAEPSCLPCYSHELFLLAMEVST